MTKESPERITQGEMEYIQSNLQHVDTKKRDTFFTKKKINKRSQIVQLSVVLQQPLGSLNTDYLI